MRLNAWTCLHVCRHVGITLLFSPFSPLHSLSSSSVPRSLHRSVGCYYNRDGKKSSRVRRASSSFAVCPDARIGPGSTSLTEREREREREKDTRQDEAADRFSRTKLGSAALGWRFAFFSTTMGKARQTHRHEFSAKSIPQSKE